MTAACKKFALATLPIAPNCGKWTKTCLCVAWFDRSMVCVPMLDVSAGIGDQMRHKVAGVREKKVRDLNLHDDTERSTAQRLEVVNPSDMLINTFALRPPFSALCNTFRFCSPAPLPGFAGFSVSRTSLTCTRGALGSRT